MLAYLANNKQKLFFVFAFIALVMFAFALYFKVPIILVTLLIVPIFLIAVYDFRIFYFLLVGTLPLAVNLIEFGIISMDVPDEPIMIGLTLLTPFVFMQHAKSWFVKHFINNAFVGLLLASLLWIFACVLASNYVWLGTKFFLAKIWYLIPFVCCTTLIAFKNPKFIYKTFIASCVSLALIIIVTTIRHATYAFSFEDVNLATEPIFRNHVIYGTIMSLFVPLLIGSVLLCKKYTWQWWALVFVLALDILAVYLAYSRGAWAAVLFALVVYFAIKRKRVVTLFSLFYAAVFSAIVWLSINNKFIEFAPDSVSGIMHDNLVDHLIATVKGRDISSNERFYRWVAAVRMFPERPFMGTGPNTFYEYYKAYTVRKFKTYVSANEEHSTVHNYFLFTLVEQGIPGTLFYGALILLVFYKGQKLYYRVVDKHTKVVILSTLCMMAAFFVNNFLSELLENDKAGGMFFIGVGILIALELREDYKEQFGTQEIDYYEPFKLQS